MCPVDLRGFSLEYVEVGSTKNLSIYYPTEKIKFCISWGADTAYVRIPKAYS